MEDRIPILKLGRALLVTIQVDMHDRLALALEEDLTQKIVATGARGVLIDISALEVVDSFIGRMLNNIAAVSRILDADTVVVGIQPPVAITLIELGLTLSGVKTALDVERGMKMISQDVGADGAGTSPCKRAQDQISFQYEPRVPYAAQLDFGSDAPAARAHRRRFNRRTGKASPLYR